MTPPVRLMAGDGDIGAAVGGREIEGSIKEHVGEKADKLTLTVSNYDGRLAKPTKGQTLSVSLGYLETGLEPMGVFIVEDVGKDGPVATFAITAHAADFMSMLKAKRTRVFANTTFGALVSTMAQDAGLQPSVDPSLASIQIVHEPQTEESDMHMLTRLARRFDAVAKPGNGKLVVVPRGGGTNGEGDALDAMTVTPNDLTKWHFGGGNRPKHGTVTADYYDKDKGERVPKTAGKAGDPEYHLGHLHPDADHAQKHADATSKQFARKEQRMTGEMWGQPWVHAGSLYTTDGFGDDDDRQWTMVTAEHLFGSKTGLATHFEGEPKS